MEVPEDVDPGYRVVTVKATDADKEGTVQYSISSGGDGKFTVDPTTGMIKFTIKTSICTSSYSLKILPKWEMVKEMWALKVKILKCVN